MTNKTFGTHDIARFCHVTPPTVIRWIEEGKLPSFTTGGGHRRVWGKDLIGFLKLHNIPVPPEVGPASELKILIVDDEPEIRRMLVKSLRKSHPDAEIYEATDGYEAGYKTIRFLPSLIILDIQLPGVNGFRICQMIRRDEKLKGIKVLAITGKVVDESKKEILDAGADDFLAKPFGLEDMTNKINQLLASVAK